MMITTLILLVKICLLLQCRMPERRSLVYIILHQAAMCHRRAFVLRIHWIVKLLKVHCMLTKAIIVRILIATISGAYSVRH